MTLPVAGLWTTALRLCTRHQDVLLGTAHVVYFPLGFLLAADLPVSWAQRGQPSGSELSTLAIVFSLAIVLYPFTGPVSNAALARTTARACTGRQASVVDAYRPVWSRSGQLLGGSGLWCLAVLVASVCLVLPGIWAGIRLMFIPTIIAIEGCGAVEAAQRSWRLTEGHFWDGLWLYLRLALLSFAGAVIALAVHTSLLGPALQVAEGSEFDLAAGLFLMVSLLLILRPFTVACLTLRYLDLRFSQQAFDLDTLSRELDAGRRDDLDPDLAKTVARGWLLAALRSLLVAFPLAFTAIVALVPQETGAQGAAAGGWMVLVWFLGLVATWPVARRLGRSGWGWSVATLLTMTFSMVVLAAMPARPVATQGGGNMRPAAPQPEEKPDANDADHACDPVGPDGGEGDGPEY